MFSSRRKTALVSSVAILCATGVAFAEPDAPFHPVRPVTPIHKPVGVVLPKPIGVIPKPIGVVPPKPIGIIPKPIGIIPKPIGIIPKPIGVLPPHPVGVLPPHPIGVLPPHPIGVLPPHPIGVLPPHPVGVLPPHPVGVLPPHPVGVLPPHPVGVLPPHPIGVLPPHPIGVLPPHPIGVLPPHPIGVLPPHPIGVLPPHPIGVLPPHPIGVLPPHPIGVPIFPKPPVVGIIVLPPYPPHPVHPFPPLPYPVHCTPWTCPWPAPIIPVPVYVPGAPVLPEPLRQFTISCVAPQGAPQDLSEVNLIASQLDDTSYELEGTLTFASQGGPQNFQAGAAGEISDTVQLGIQGDGGMLLQPTQDEQGNVYLAGTMRLPQTDYDNALQCAVQELQ